MYYCCGITETGNVKTHNEDAYLIGHTVVTDRAFETELRGPLIAAVADGVSGEAKGEVAARMTLELLADIRPSGRTDYKKKVMAIHEKIKRYGASHKGHENMQTTLCAVVIDSKDVPHIINVGDSRLFRMSQGRLRQLSTDQSLVQLLYSGGHMTNEQRLYSNDRNLILPVIGNTGSDPDPQIIVTEPLGYGEMILICSDGLSDYLTPGETEDILALPQRLPKRLSALAAKAVENGSRDNITVVAVSAAADR